jgi:hypothetical protein
MRVRVEISLKSPAAKDRHTAPNVFHWSCGCKLNSRNSRHLKAEKYNLVEAVYLL